MSWQSKIYHKYLLDEPVAKNISLRMNIMAINYLVLVYKVLCLIQNVRGRGILGIENKELTKVSDWFQYQE